MFLRKSFSLLLALVILTASVPLLASANTSLLDRYQPAALTQGTPGTPTASSSSLLVTRNTSKSGQLLAFDPGGLPLTYTVATAPTLGTLSSFEPSTGAFTYTPRHNKLHNDSFTFYVSNGTNISNLATVSITIEPKTFESLIYEDLKTHWAWYSAGQLGAMDTIKGEKIQDLYYFNPNRIMTRADFLLCVNSVFEIPRASTPTSMFADVTSPYLIPPLNAAFEANIISGSMSNGNRYFHPNSPITRVEAIVILEKALDFSVQNRQPLPFLDRDDVPIWALPAVQNMFGHLIVLGDNDDPALGRIRPMGQLTRAEGISMLYKAYTERLEQLNLIAP